MYTLSVATASHQYPIFIGSNLLESAQQILTPYLNNKIAIISNDTVAALYLSEWQQILTQSGYEHFSIILPDGEQYKNWQTLNLIYDGLMQHRAERQTTLLALGGGVIGDMVGFAAATYQRGAPFIQIPTTLLSQVDSSVGGKTAINHPLGKNMIGAFYQPQAVFIDLNSLQTLPAREFSAGLAEVIKYAVLGDIEFLQWLENNITALIDQNPAILAQAVYRCCQMKADIVGADEKEAGIRAYLNLGHTFGHAIEAEMGYGNWLHGEAVAAGTVLACRLSEQLGYLRSEDTARVITLLAKANLPVVPPAMSLQAWLTHMSHDKKVIDGNLRFVVVKTLGEAALADNITTETLTTTLKQFIS
ncbi:3-dehydroquinate synthase [Snodgrassella alvi]|uniref:3-dehydroquinate synthase n=1 Tax=Snodgrassella alvi TaxID=1196083 RepID=A0A855FMA4_9NEIS|nr:3-dehydroquinate synthase [Snodgrassella alvi]PIT59228.1 3-dehydroquinate synthase [Snodgrassella alvi]